MYRVGVHRLGYAHQLDTMYPVGVYGPTYARQLDTLYRSDVQIGYQYHLKT